MARKKSEETDAGQDAPPDETSAEARTPGSEDQAAPTSTDGSGPAGTRPDADAAALSKPTPAEPDGTGGTLTGDPAEPAVAADPYASDPYVRPDAEAPAERAADVDAIDDARTEPLPAYAADDEIPDEERGSFAAKALTALVLLLIGAGIGIWAAPKVAPMLPSGMAPVANWLTPQAAGVEDEIAALQQKLDAELASLNQQVAALPDAASVDAKVEAARSDLAGQIDQISQTLQQSDPAAIGERVGRLETAVGGATSELASLKDQIASGAASLSEDAAQSIDTYRAELEGLRTQVTDLSGAVSGLGGRLDQVQSDAEARVARATSQAQEVQETAAAERDYSAAQADLAAISAAIAAGQPYSEALRSLTDATGLTPPDALQANAATGVPSELALRESFGPAAHEAIRATIAASAGDGMFARARAFAESQVASRSLTPQAGPSPDAVLSRMEEALRRDDVAAALDEANALPSEATAAMSDWLAQARQRAEAQSGLAEITAAVENTN